MQRMMDRNRDEFLSFEIGGFFGGRYRVIGDGIELVVVSAEENTVTQQDQVKNFITQEVDAIVVIPVGGGGLARQQPDHRLRRGALLSAQLRQHLAVGRVLWQRPQLLERHHAGVGTHGS